MKWGQVISRLCKDGRRGREGADSTWRLLCSSFLVITCLLIGDYDILPKKKLHRSLQVDEDCAAIWESPTNRGHHMDHYGPRRIIRTSTKKGPLIAGNSGWFGTAKTT